MVRRLLPLLLVFAACSSGDDPPSAEPDRTTTSTTSTTSTTVAVADPAVTATVDWTARIVTVEGTEFGVAFCEGEAPLLCITSPDGDHLGAFEHAEFDAVDDLEAHAKEFSMTMREDRVAGCDPAFELEPATTVETTLFGAPGVRYGYTGSIAGREVERVVAHAANVDGRLHLVTANFLADDGCMSRESELPIGVADALEPVLDAVVAGSTR